MSKCRFLRFLIVVLLCAHISLVWAEQQYERAAEIAQRLASTIALDQPIFLDIRCGEWTPALTRSLSELLLEQSADIRETRTHALDTDFSAESERIPLSDYGLERALLVQVQMNIKWHTTEHKSFFSYRSERNPVNSFVVKQVQLPQQRLIGIDNYDFVQNNAQDSVLSAPRLHWFEPLIATTAIASIIFLLWTIE